MASPAVPTCRYDTGPSVPVSAQSWTLSQGCWGLRVRLEGWEASEAGGLRRDELPLHPAFFPKDPAGGRSSWTRAILELSFPHQNLVSHGPTASGPEPSPVPPCMASNCRLLEGSEGHWAAFILQRGIFQGQQGGKRPGQTKSDSPGPPPRAEAQGQAAGGVPHSGLLTSLALSAATKKARTDRSFDNLFYLT